MREKGKRGRVERGEREADEGWRERGGRGRVEGKTERGGRRRKQTSYTSSVGRLKGNLIR